MKLKGYEMNFKKLPDDIIYNINSILSGYWWKPVPGLSPTAAIVNKVLLYSPFHCSRNGDLLGRVNPRYYDDIIGDPGMIWLFFKERFPTPSIMVSRDKWSKFDKLMFHSDVTIVDNNNNRYYYAQVKRKPGTSMPG